MTDILDRLKNETVNIVQDFPGSDSGDTVNITIYRLSDGYYWNFSTEAMQSGSTNGTMTYKSGNFFSSSFVPPTADDYLVTMENTTLAVTRSITVHVSGGSPVTTYSSSWSKSLYTASQLLTRIRYRIEDPDSTEYSDNELIDYINDCVDYLFRKIFKTNRDFFKNTELWERKQYTLAADQQDYALSSSTYYIVRVFLDYIELEEKSSIREFQLSTPDNVYVTSYTGVRVRSDVGYQLVEVSGQKYIRIMPTPESASATDALTVDVANKPARIDETTDQVALSADFDTLIVAYAGIRAKVRNHEETVSDTAFLRLFEDCFTETVGAINLDYRGGFPSDWEDFEN